MMPMRSSNLPTETRRGGFFVFSIFSTTFATSAGSARAPHRAHHRDRLLTRRTIRSSPVTSTFLRAAVKLVLKLPVRQASRGCEGRDFVGERSAYPSRANLLAL